MEKKERMGDWIAVIGWGSNIEKEERWKKEEDPSRSGVSFHISQREKEETGKEDLKRKAART